MDTLINSQTGTQPGFQLLRVSTGKVETVTCFDYVCGVVAAEVPASFEPEALKAQAAAAYTYAYYHRALNRVSPVAGLSGADISDDYNHYDAYISKQEAQAKWGGSFESSWAKIAAAVAAVENKIITYDGKPIDALFFATSTGKTENSVNVWGGSTIPYLMPVDSPWDEAAPDFKSTVKVKQADFLAKVQAKYKDAKVDKNPANWLSIKKSSASGVVLSVELCGKSLTGGNISALFGLNSSDFSVSLQNGEFIFDVRGNGHDVGMSQNGAQALAKQGKTWEQIVKYYYTGVAITDYTWQ